MKQKWIWRVLFVVYCALMCLLLFQRLGYEPGIPYTEQLKFNLIPFRTIRLFWEALHSHTYRTAAVINLFGNVIMFIPLGFLLPRVFWKLESVWKVLLTVVFSIIAVELLQLLTLVGTCDIDDLILNVIGAAMGYILHTNTKKILSK